MRTPRFAQYCCTLHASLLEYLWFRRLFLSSPGAKRAVITGNRNHTVESNVRILQESKQLSLWACGSVIGVHTPYTIPLEEAYQEDSLSALLGLIFGSASPGDMWKLEVSQGRGPERLRSDYGELYSCFTDSLHPTFLHVRCDYDNLAACWMCVCWGFGWLAPEISPSKLYIYSQIRTSYLTLPYLCWVHHNIRHGLDLPELQRGLDADLDLNFSLSSVSGCCFCFAISTGLALSFAALNCWILGTYKATWHRRGEVCI